MPLTIPSIDDRTHQQLVDEALARVPIHTPEWTNFNKSDPGVTLVELFAFLTENLLYRANQIPERSRRKFLTLLGMKLQPASSAQGLVTLSNERGPLQTFTLNEGVEVRAGAVPFRTEHGLDVLPIEAAAYYKRTVTPDATTSGYYNDLYASFTTQQPAPDLKFYETTPFSPRGSAAVELGQDAIDQSLWIALMIRPVDKPYEERLEKAREELVGKTLSLGIVPATDETGRQLAPGGRAQPAQLSLLRVQLPSLPPGGALSERPDQRNATYKTLASLEMPTGPAVLDVPLPASKDELGLWTNLDPLEAGTADFPPALDNEDQNQRLLTWLRVSCSTPAQLKLLWVGINAAEVTQRAPVLNELLPTGTGEPDQQMKLARAPVLPASVQLTVTVNGQTETWTEIDDLASAGPEVLVPDPRLPPGTPTQVNPLVKVFAVDPEAGELRFGDGLRGARPPLGAILRASYDYGVGAAGNVGPDALTSGPSLPPGTKVTNPIQTWGGADAETVATGEKQISRYLQHRDRLVTAQDFETLTLRTPGVAVGRVEVLPAFHPLLSANEPGDAPGAVTVMAIPRYDPDPPALQGPDTFLDAIACWLAPRRLVTTQVFIRRPEYVPVWVTVGVDVVAGVSTATVREAVKQALLQFLSPLPAPDVELLADQELLAATPQYSSARKGWPLRKPVVALELSAVASRVEGVQWVQKVRLGLATGSELDQIPMTGLQLPRLAGISVAVGDAPSLDDPRGTATPSAQRPFVPVPVVPEECK